MGTEFGNEYIKWNRRDSVAVFCVYDWNAWVYKRLHVGLLHWKNIWNKYNFSIILSNNVSSGHILLSIYVQKYALLTLDL